MTNIKPPTYPKKTVVQKWHGIEKRDDYAWLRADNWQEVMQAPEKLPQNIRAILEAENAYQEAMMADTASLQEDLFSEMKGRIKQDDSTVPAPDGPYAYYMSYVSGGQYPRFCRKLRDLSGDEQLLIDGDACAAAHDYFQLGDMMPSHDHRLIAWSFDDKGSEYYAIEIIDAESGVKQSDDVRNTSGDVVWAKDNKSFFYTLQDGHHRPLKTYHHILGQLQSEDRLVYEEKDEGFFTSVASTHSGDYVVIDVHDHETSESYLINAATPCEEPLLVAKRVQGCEYDIEHHEQDLIILTNADGAEDFKFVIAPLSNPSRDQWRDFIPHRPGCLIVSYAVFKDWLVRIEQENGLPRIVVHHFADHTEHIIKFDEEAYALGFGEMREYDTDIMRFTYSSMTTPNQIYDYDMRTHARRLLKVQEIPSGHDQGSYVTKRLQAPSYDGALVPITLLYKKGTKLDGSAPLWLYGYGSYGHALPASFNSARLSLVDRGFVYAFAHVRGGEEKGRRWYKEGKHDKKMNSFHDFIAVARYLCSENFTHLGNIIAHGGSAGGLLVGAVANMAPELFAAIIAQVPFVDALTTMLDDTLPLTPPEWPEWGNPILNKADYQNIASYSPYDQIKQQDYPAILAIAGVTDPRVTYWEPLKWVARLRAMKTDHNLLLLKTNMEAGHAGVTGRFDRLKELAHLYAFGLKVSAKI